MSIFRAASTLALATMLALTAAPAFSYSVSNNKIVDDNGNVVQLKGVNVFGFETGNHVMHVPSCGTPVRIPKRNGWTICALSPIVTRTCRA